jgi:hypothetical protein
MLYHIKITILNEKINKNNTKNNPDSITSAKNEKCIIKLVLVFFNFLHQIQLNVTSSTERHQLQLNVTSPSTERDRLNVT